MKRAFTLVLDEEYEERLVGYCLYRSREMGRKERPVIDGLYVQREELPEPPPKTIKATIDL